MYTCACVDSAQASFDAQLLRANVFLVSGALLILGMLLMMLVWTMADCLDCEDSHRMQCWCLIPVMSSIAGALLLATAVNIDVHRFFEGCGYIEP